jgi:tRNA-uridine 2-sulfurtransferase
MQKKVLVAISGGIDSAVAAHKLKEQGYCVTGLHLNLTGSEVPETKLCLDVISERLGIEILKFDARQLFCEEVIGYFTRMHLAGMTPSPCAHCNPFVKWKLLQQLAEKSGIAHVATGHYIRIVKENGLQRIFRATDRTKDQSYYLWNLDQSGLHQALAPLGCCTKKHVYSEARKLELDLLTKKSESSGLCFSEGKSIEAMLMKYCPGLSERITSGEIVDRTGKVIGEHKGYFFYTIGQKRGLNIGGNEKLCVVQIEPEKNRLVADRWESLYSRKFCITESHFFNPDELHQKADLQVMIRGFGLNPTGFCRLSKIRDDRYEVQLDEPAWAPAPGQPAVFYLADKLAGGGIIARES